jgi:hypothetical protein
MASRCSQIFITRREIEVDRNSPCFARRKHTKKSAVAVRHLCPHLGADGAIRFAAVRAFSALPAEIKFNSTLPGIHGYIGRVDWFPIGPKGSLGKTRGDSNREFAHLHWLQMGSPALGIRKL